MRWSGQFWSPLLAPVQVVEGYTNPTLERWSLKLSEYDYDVIHKPVKSMWYLMHCQFRWNMNILNQFSRWWWMNCCTKERFWYWSWLDWSTFRQPWTREPALPHFCTQPTDLDIIPKPLKLLKPQCFHAHRFADPLGLLSNFSTVVPMLCSNGPLTAFDLQHQLFVKTWSNFFSFCVGQSLWKIITNGHALDKEHPTPLVSCIYHHPFLILKYQIRLKLIQLMKHWSHF